MITISAFADEIGPDLKLQMDICEANGIKCIDVRGIDNKNVSAMTLAEVRQYRKQLDDRGFAVPCVGSPIGKIRIDEDFDAHLDLLKHCCDVAKAFGAPLIRVFSFYPSQDANIMDQRSEVMDRMAAMVEVAEAAGVALLHENEKAIYGAKPDGVKDIFATIKSENLKSAFDPANFVEEGIAPYDQAWQVGLGDLTHYFHVKDKAVGAEICIPAGQGNGQFQELFADVKSRNWSGYATLEPHMSVAGQFAGFTGPESFHQAAASFKGLLDNLNIAYN